MDHSNSMRQPATAECQSPAAALHLDDFLGEPALSDILRDPIAEALMVADHVGHHDLHALLEAARRHLRHGGTAPAGVESL
jgi:hypothetical protein